MKIGLLGFGTVGGGIGAIIVEQKERLAQLLGEEVVLAKALVKDVNDHRGTAFEAFVTEDVNDILDDPHIEVVFEALGGIDVPFKYVSRALKAKKHVITANKALICAHYSHLQQTANENGVTLSIEACVGGGIPIIATLEDQLLFGKTHGIHGILNGTGNYILSKIQRDQCTFASALSEAQALGYAEQIPDDDVDGYDAARKIIILTALVHGVQFGLEHVVISSIRPVSPIDFDILSDLKATLRYIVSCEETQDGLYLSARPSCVPIYSSFGQTFGPDNTLVFEHSHLNTLTLKGPGAGKYPTANAMLGDLVRLKGKALRYKPTFITQAAAEAPTKKYYARVNQADHASAQALWGLLEEKGFATAIKEAQQGRYYLLVTTKRPQDLLSLVKQYHEEVFIAEYGL